jgi:hypothetical protein
VDAAAGLFNPGGANRYSAYLDGSSVSSTDYYPWFQGTSTTAAGYIDNSTAPRAPARASVKNIYNGDNNWWFIAFNGFGANTVNTTEFLKSYLDCQFVANANCTIQVNFGYGKSDGLYRQVLDTGLATYNLTANLPINVSIVNTVEGSGVIDGGGVMIRNITPGVRLYTPAGTLVQTKRKKYTP